MFSLRSAVVPLRLFLVVLFAILILLQTLSVPGAAWLVFVMRSLLRQTTTLRTEMEVVI